MTDASDMDRIGTRMVESLEGVFGPASPATVFSAPEIHGDRLVITAAAWERAGGFGFGAGSGHDPSGRSDGGGGGGGGGTSVTRPVAVITIQGDRVRVDPVIDVTKLAVTVVLSALGVWRAMRSW